MMDKPKRPAFDKAANLLARRMMTEKQVREALAKADSKSGGYPADEIEDAVARLKELGYIDDKAYAERYLEVLIDKKRGRRRIREEMRRRGIDVALIDETISAGFADEIERENAVALTEKIIAGLPEGTDRRFAAQRISRRLIGQGYQFDLINSVIDEAFSRISDE
ncbi:MAG: RecX family transcriptional regulator [Clostridiales Family XIII bacterium]|nr:RecX family transcriptional regulator [Clostridiales Family XIII bacterium]